MTKRKLDDSSNNSTTMRSIKVGLFGGGVVGGGVVELVSRCIASNRFASIGADIEITKICVRSLDKPRDFQVKPNCKLVTNYNDILDDTDINCIVELIGGTSQARNIVFSAIKKGKHVVTANKALIAAYLPEIQAALKEPCVSIRWQCNYDSPAEYRLPNN